MNSNRSTILPRSFYEREDVVEISRRLIGKVLCSKKGNRFTSGIITETEAYCGRDDRACHANDGLRTRRTEVMYGPAGHAYVYLCYGIHHLFNVVTNKENIADAVLIRGVYPLQGIEIMKQRRNNTGKSKPLTSGPGMLSEALGIKTSDTCTDLTEGPIWIEDHDFKVDKSSIRSTPRIGVEYAGEHAKREWRFVTDQFIN